MKKQQTIYSFDIRLTLAPALLFLLMLLVVQVDSGYRGCRKIPSTEVDEEWLRKIGSEEGFYVPMTSNCDNCETLHNFNWVTVLEVKSEDDYEDKLILKPRARSINEEMCWNYDLITRNRGPLNITLHCEKKEHFGNQENCKSDDEFQLLGTHTITRTDNTTYFAGHTCFTGKENFYWVGSIWPELPEELRQMLEKHFRNFGWNTKNLAKESSIRSPVVLTKFRIVDCAKTDSGSNSTNQELESNN